MTSKCPVTGCSRDKDSKYLMCWLHWKIVPVHMQQDVWRTWHAMNRHPEQEESVRAYREARNAAIRLVEAACV